MSPARCVDSMSDLHDAFVRYAASVDPYEYQALSRVVFVEHSMEGVYLLAQVAEENEPDQLEAAFTAALPDMPPLDW